MAQPPEDGKVNRAVEALLAEALDLPPSHVSVVTGHANPRKTIRILHLPADEALKRILSKLPPKK